jgi:hypothetical protein
MTKQNSDYEVWSALYPHDEERTAWEATLEQEAELRTTYPGGKDEFFARLWDEPSRSELERLGPLCGVSLEGRARGSFAPDADASLKRSSKGSGSVPLRPTSPRLTS